MGVLKVKTKHYREAIKHLTVAEGLGLTTASVYYFRGRALQKLGRYREAFTYYGKALTKAPLSKRVAAKCREVMYILVRRHAKKRGLEK